MLRVCRCQPGRYSQEGQESCTFCPEDTVTDAYGSTECIQCPVNSRASFDLTQCECVPGYYLPSYDQVNVFNCVPW